jgi:serine/threonine protein phosphatase 1
MSSGGRKLAIGDIHGCDVAFKTLLAMIQPRPADTIVTLGDYVDRGPDSRGVVDMLLTLEKDCHLIPLLGNHEQMMLEAADQPETMSGWLMFGGLETLASYGLARDAYEQDSIPAAHRAFFVGRCREWFETDTHLFVHAGVEPHLPLAEQQMEVLRWDKLRDRGPHQSGKTVICGHTRQVNGRPLDLGHTICIDTWVYGDGWLTCLDLATRRYWQANQRGESRDGVLEEV